MPRWLIITGLVGSALLTLFFSAYTQSSRSAAEISPLTSPGLTAQSPLLAPILVTGLDSPLLMPTAIPTIFPPIRKATDRQLPKITHDLVFVNEEGLQLWNHATGTIETLVGLQATRSRATVNQPVALHLGSGPAVGSVWRVSTSVDARKIALLRFGGVVNHREQFDLDFYDLPTRSRITLLAKTSPLVDMALAPNGEWIAYILRDAPPIAHRSPGLAAPIFHPNAEDGPESSVVYLMQTKAPFQPIQIGTYTETRAAQLLWSPDSREVLWTDGLGVWKAKREENSAQLIARHQIPENGFSVRIYTPDTMSPTGRYAHLWMHHYEGSSQGVLNTETGEVIEVPNTFEYVRPNARTTWLDDGRLFVTRPGSIMGSIAPAIELWSLHSNRALRLELDEVVTIPVGVANFPTAPMWLADGRVAFALLNTSATNYRERGFYSLDLRRQQFRYLNSVPPSAVSDSEQEAGKYYANIDWVPDGTGAIFEDQDLDLLLYVPLDGSAPYDLKPIFGLGPREFVWLSNPNP